MKKFYILFLLIALPFVGFAQTTIGSYTFDTDVEGWANAGATTFEYNAANYYNAAGSLLMVGGINKLITSPKLDITAGTYTFTFRVKGTVGTILRPQIKDITNNVATNGDSFTIPASGGDTGGDSGAWFELTQTIEVVAGSQYGFRVQNKSGSAATFYIDDATIVKADVSGNILTVNIDGSTLNTVDANPLQASYAPTDVVALTATAGTHWSFDSWTGDLTGSTNPDDITMDADKTVTANFVVDPAFNYDFTFDIDGNLEGWTFDPQVSVASQTGGLLTLSITADQWSRLNLFDFPIPATSTDPDRYNKVTIIVKNEEISTDQLGVTLGPNNETRVYPLASDAAFQTFEIDLTQFEDWTGDIESFRIRFADADNPDATGRPSVSQDVVIDNVVFSYDSSLGVKDVDFKDDASISIYPNPVQNVLKINAPNTIEKIEVYNILGQKMLDSKSANQINVESLSKGMYISKIFMEDDIISTKRFFKD